MLDIEGELKDLDLALKRARVAASECVSKFKEASDDDLRYLIAERLPTLGPMILPELLDVVRDGTLDPTLRYLAAWVALTVGDRNDSVTMLREEVLRDSPWSLAAANALARHRVASSRTEIAMALDRVSQDRDNPEIAQYSTALRQVGGEISPATRARIVTDNTSWVARSVQSDFPAEAD